MIFGLSGLSGLPLLALLACGGGDAYIVEGTVVEVHPPREVVLDHEAIAGLGMPAMVMPFDVADPALLDGLTPGTEIVARYKVAESGSAIVRVRVTGHHPLAQAEGPVPLRVGEQLPAVTLQGADGEPVVLGPEQGARTVLTVLYTRCPRPEFCPATVARLAALDQALGDTEGVRIVAVTLDPAFDTPEVLTAYGEQVGATARWSLARLEGQGLDDLAMRAGLPVLRDQPGEDGESTDIAHGLRVLVLDADGTLIERYDDLRFPLERVVQQLRTGAPKGDPSVSGTVTPEPG
ncbi:MAG: SCO family protein [Myxococcota bacterium]